MKLSLVVKSAALAAFVVGCGDTNHELETFGETGGSAPGGGAGASTGGTGGGVAGAATGGGAGASTGGAPSAGMGGMGGTANTGGSSIMGGAANTGGASATGGMGNRGGAGAVGASTVIVRARKKGHRNPVALCYYAWTNHAECSQRLKPAG